MNLKKNYDSIIAAIIGMLIIYAYTKHSGIGISPDSVYYLSTARNLYTLGSALDYSKHYLVIFPLLYPALLAGITYITHLDPFVFTPHLNAILFFILIYTSGWILEKFSNPSKWNKILVLSCLVLSPCLLEIYSMMWSETLFLLLLLYFIISLNHYLKEPSIKKLLLVSIIVSIACITRYVGVTLIACGGIMIILTGKLSSRKKISHLLFFGALSSSFLIANLVHNNLDSTTFTGMRLKSDASLLNNIYYLGNVLCSWLPIPENKFLLAVIVAAVLIIVFLTVFLKRFLKQKDLACYENISMAFFVIYTLFMIFTATVSRFEIFTSRLVSPAFIPMVFGGSSILLSFAKKSTINKTRIWSIALGLLVFIAFQISQLKTDYENYDGIKDAGMPGYTEDPWQKDSEIVNFLRTHKNVFNPAWPIYSNTDDAVYFFTGLTSYNLPHHLLEVEKKHFMLEKNCYLIWFDDNENLDILNLEEALQEKRMKLLYKFSNGSIYVSE